MMPMIISYLNRITPSRSYDEAEIKMLQRVYDRARDELRIDATDPRRETLAILIFHVADTVDNDEKILERVVAAFRSL